MELDEVRANLRDDLLCDQHPRGGRLDIGDELALKVGLGLVLEYCLLDSADELGLVLVRQIFRLYHGKCLL